ncbi:MAG: response regulator transcription factor [Acidobacteria bacterium]|nr:response regulator transcription factor [Acidobacteriota bacterium]
MNSILIVDDDKELCELVSEYLKEEGFEVKYLNSPESALSEILSGLFSIVILDVMLPKINGFELLRLIRAKSNIPVLMLTAKGQDIDRIVGLEIGADDYMAKPFNSRELVARIRAILRRIKVENLSENIASEIINLGDISLNTATMTVSLTGKVVENLTTVEFDLLKVLLKASGSVVNREDLAEQALGRRFSPFDRSIDTHMSNLRKKLAQHSIDSIGTERIKSIRGVGYRYIIVE